EVVAEAPDALRDHDAGLHGVGYRGERDAPPAAADPHADPAERDRPPDAQPTVPDEQRLDRLVGRVRPEVELPVGDDVVEPAADEPEGHGPDGEVGDRARVAAPGAPAALPHDDGDHDTEHDAEGVGPDGDRPQ